MGKGNEQIMATGYEFGEFLRIFLKFCLLWLMKVILHNGFLKFKFFKNHNGKEVQKVNMEN